MVNDRDNVDTLKNNIYNFYREIRGVSIARKHLTQNRNTRLQEIEALDSNAYDLGYIAYHVSVVSCRATRRPPQQVRISLQQPA